MIAIDVERRLIPVLSKDWYMLSKDACGVAQGLRIDTYVEQGLILMLNKD